MSENICKHCHAKSTDSEFCDTCGRALSVQLESLSLEAKWIEDSLICSTTITKWNLEAQLKNVHLACIEKPLVSVGEGGNFKNFYINTKKSLEQFLVEQESVSFELIDRIIYCIADLFSQVNEAGYVFGGVDLSDFWLQDDCLETLVYRPLRPMFKANSICEVPETFDFYSQEYINKKPLSYSSDVFIIGSIFTALLHKKLSAFTTIAEMRYIAHQIIPQRKDFQVSLYPWLYRSTSIYEEERYSTVAEQMKYYSDCLKNTITIIPDEIQVATLTDVGDKKRQLDGDEAELNQDRVYFAKGNHCVFGLVADGISTAKVGSGSIAAQTVKEFASVMWKKEQDSLTSEEAIESFLTRFAQQANEAVVAKSFEIAEQLEDVRPSHLMGTTLVAVVSTNEYAYTISVGDSRVYHWSPDTFLKPLHSDQNVRNEMLLQGIEWSEVRSTEEQSSLTYYIGMADTSKKPFIAKEILVDIRKTDISSEDLILLCSDGLTDYLNPIGYQNDLWKADSVLTETIKQFVEQQDWTACAEKLVQLANDNGGGDNISVLLLTFNETEKKNNEFEEEL